MCGKIWVKVKMLGKVFGIWANPEDTIEDICKYIVPDDWEQLYYVVSNSGKFIDPREKVENIINVNNEIEIVPQVTN